MRSIVLGSILLLTFALACNEPSPRYDGIEEPPKQFADEHISFRGPPPDQHADNRPPGHGTRGTVSTPEVVGGGGPELRAEKALDRESQADAVIAPAPGVVSFAGVAELAETPQGVQMAVAVSKAPPGQHQLALATHGTCREAASLDEEKTAEPDTKRPSAQIGEKIGVIEVGRDGEALFKVTLPNASLKSGDKGSVLGKSVILREQKPAANRAGDEPGRVLGCGVVTQGDGE